MATFTIAAKCIGHLYAGAKFEAHGVIGFAARVVRCNRIEPADLLETPEMKRKSLAGNACPIARTLDLIGDWWSLLIIRDALDGISRFGDFEKSLDIAKNMLSVRLKGLVERDILRMVPASDGSAYKEYVLTEKGRALQTVIVALSQWGGEHLYAPGEPGSVMVDVQRGQPIRKLELLSADGRVLAPEDVATKLAVEH